MSDLRCDQCETRIDGDPFWYQDHPFCCECMSALCSWFLDGGMTDAPELFDYIDARARAQA